MVERLPSTATDYGSVSTVNMTQEPSARIGILQGTLEMLILRILRFGPAHGHQIAKHIQRTTDDVLQVEHGSLYPALHRLERKGWLASKWELAKDRNRELKYYSLTAAGRNQLIAEESKWKQLTGAIARIMWPAKES
jgi:transcriptional regulator